MQSSDEFHRHKETKSRNPVGSWHNMVRGAFRVLAEQGGGPLPSVAIFRRGVELRLFEPHQYNSLRARLSQHCDLDDAVVVRAFGSKVGVRGSRTTAWVLADSGLGVQKVEMNGGLNVGRVRISDAKRRILQRERAARAAGHARNVVVDDAVLTGAPESTKLIAGRTAREALTTPLDGEAVNWLLTHLPLEESFRARLVAASGAEERSVIIEAEERTGRTA